MPNYNFRCGTCGHEFEAQSSYGTDGVKPVQCRSCGDEAQMFWKKGTRMALRGTGSLTTAERAYAWTKFGKRFETVSERDRFLKNRGYSIVTARDEMEHVERSVMTRGEAPTRRVQAPKESTIEAVKMVKEQLASGSIPRPSAGQGLDGTPDEVLNAARKAGAIS